MLVAINSIKEHAKKHVMAHANDYFTCCIGNYTEVREYSNKDSSSFFYHFNFDIIYRSCVCENVAKRTFCKKSFNGTGCYPYPDVVYVCLFWGKANWKIFF